MFEQRLEHFHSTDFSKPNLGMSFVYPPLSAVILEVLHVTGSKSRVVFFISLGLIACCISFAFALGLRRYGLGRGASALIVMSTFALSYPFSVEYGRENVEIYLWAVLMCAAWAIWRDRPGYAAFFIGVGIALKYYPAVMLLLFARRGRWHFAFTACAVAIFLHVAALWAVGGPHLFDTQRAMAAAFGAQRELYMLTRIGSGMEHSLYGTMKMPLLIPHPPRLRAARLLLSAYVPGAGLLVLLLWKRLRRLPLPNQLAAVFLLMVLLPPTSFDYTLMHLYAVWAVLLLVLLRAGSAGVEGATACFALLGLCTSPQDALFIRTVEFGGMLKCCALLAMLYLVSRWPWSDPRHQVTTAS